MAVEDIFEEIEDVSEESEDFLDVKGICYFPDEVVTKPVQVRIASPYIGVTDLIKSLVVIGEHGLEYVPYSKGVQKVIGVIKDDEIIDFLQNMYGGRGLLFASPENPTLLLTVDEWIAKYGTDPVALILMMRVWWNASGGGIQTP